MTDAFITDFVATGHDEALLLHPVTPAAEDWAQMHLSDASRIGVARAIPRRRFSEVADAVLAHGLTLIDGRVRRRQTNGPEL